MIVAYPKSISTTRPLLSMRMSVSIKSLPPGSYKYDLSGYRAASDTLGLQVAMADALHVNVLDGASELIKDHSTFCFVKPPLLQDRPQSTRSFDMLHYVRQCTPVFCKDECCTSRKMYMR